MKYAEYLRSLIGSEGSCFFGDGDFRFFIDAQGTLVRKFVGPTQPETLQAALDRLLALDAEDFNKE